MSETTTLTVREVLEQQAAEEAELLAMRAGSVRGGREQEHRHVWQALVESLQPPAEQLLGWLPDRWLLRRARESPPGQAAAGSASAAHVQRTRQPADRRGPAG